MPDIMELYFGKGTKSEPTNDGSVMDLYFPKNPVPKQPIETPAESVQAQEPPSMLERKGRDFLNTMGTNAKSGIDTFVSGIEDLSESRTASGVGKIGLGGIEYLGSPFSAGLKEFVNKPAAGIGGPEFGDKAELLVSGALPIGGSANLVNRARPSVRAFKDIVDRIGEENLYDVLSRLKANPRLSLFDVAPNIRTDIQGMAAKPSRAQNYLADVVKTRGKEERGIVEQAQNDLMGPTPNVKQLLDDISTQTKKVGREVINPAVKNAGAVDINSVLNHIEQRSNPGINSVVSASDPLPDDFLVKGLKDVRKFLTDDKQQLTDASRLHNIQSALRTKAETLLGSPNGQDRLMGYELFKVRERLVDAIDAASGTIDPVSKMGPYKTGLSQYRTEKEFPEAIEKGMQIFKNNPNQLENRPEFWKALIEGSSNAQIKGLKIGARLAADNQIRGMRFAARKGENIPEVEFNEERLQHLFGKTETANYKRILSDEKDINETNNLLFKGSKTASTLLGNEARKVRDPVTITDAAKNTLPFAILEAAGTYAGQPGAGTATALTIGSLMKVANVVGRKLDVKTNLDYAKLASATGSEREQLIKILEQYMPKPKPSMLQRAQQLMLPVIPP